MSRPNAHSFRGAALAVTTAAALAFGAASAAYAQAPGKKIEAPATTGSVSTSTRNIDLRTCDRIASTILDVVEHTSAKKSDAFLLSLAEFGEGKCPAPFTVRWSTPEDRGVFAAVRTLLLARTKMRPISLEELGVKLAPEPVLPQSVKPTAQGEASPRG